MQNACTLRLSDCRRFENRIFQVFLLPMSTEGSHIAEDSLSRKYLIALENGLTLPASNQLVFAGVTHQIDPAVQIELLHQVGAVSLHRTHADAQCIRDLAIGMSFDDQA